MNIGFIGVGVLAVAMVKALEAKFGDSATFHLSPRNARNAAMLRDAYGNVSVMRSNQEVVDASEVVVLAVLPDIAQEVVASLWFSPERHVVSCISEPTMVELAEWIGPCRTLARVIPLTCIEHRTGPIAAFPESRLVHDLFDGLGDVFVAGSEASFIQYQALTALLGPFYYLVDKLVKWAESHGEKREAIAPYLFSLFKALSEQGGRTNPDDISTLWGEMTPGGLNEDAMKFIEKGNGFSLWLQALDKVRQRVL